MKAVERQSLEGSLRRALKRDEFLLHYQPKVNLDTGEITGVEALVRWQQPDRGLVPPSQFVPIAEDCGLILQIVRWVLREACRQARAWQDAGLPPLPISVNVSAVEFRDKVLSKVSGPYSRKLAWKHAISNSSSPKAFLWTTPNPRPPFFKSLK